MADCQPGILAPVPLHARYLRFELTDVAPLSATIRELASLCDGEHVVLGLGASTIAALGKTIPGMTNFPSFERAGANVPSTPAALWCWLRGDDPGDLLISARHITRMIGRTFELVSSVAGFRHGGGRDLTGYEDGTENPQGDAAIDAGIASGLGAGFDGASYVAVQQWQHDLDRFNAMSRAAQDNAIGRRLEDNEEIDDAPESAHVQRTAQESFSPEAFVLRRSMPWSGDGGCGLMFVAFGHSFAAFEAQLKRMAGVEDGIADALFRFTRPVSGNYYWCPPMRAGRLDLSAVGL
jgi:putative iron-dependent peroxidase